MAVTGVNQSKTIVSPYNTVKRRNTQAVYGIGYYGLATYGIGVADVVPVNQNKSSVPTYFELEDSAIFLLENSTNLEMEGGSGAMTVTNQSKS